jgi:hypothetical protein
VETVRFALQLASSAELAFVCWERQVNWRNGEGRKDVQVVVVVILFTSSFEFVLNDELKSLILYFPGASRVTTFRENEANFDVSNREDP